MSYVYRVVTDSWFRHSAFDFCRGHIGNHVCWVEWSCDLWRHVTVWHYSGDIMQHVAYTGLFSSFATIDVLLFFLTGAADTDWVPSSRSHCYKSSDGWWCWVSALSSALWTSQCTRRCVAEWTADCTGSVPWFPLHHWQPTWLAQPHWRRTERCRTNWRFC